MDTALLIDIGSTYTKVSGFDLIEEKMVARGKALTTVDQDVTIGLHEALGQLEEHGFDWQTAKYKLACSSAAGGLQMIAIGLVPELTVEAARRAALGAGAKLLGVYAYQLTPEDVEEIQALRPDIILLAGGTDGGNTSNIIHNARMLASSSLTVPIVVAGNKVAAPEVVRILRDKGKDVRRTENVMPELEELNILPARETIRQVFLERIVRAKGLDRAREMIDGVLMPTPAAVLQGAELLSKGVEGEGGFGDLLIVDVGGATTDVHSAASGEPTRAGVNLRGLEEPFLKRTVEGDLGMRYSAQGVLEAASRRDLLTLLQQLSPGCDGKALWPRFNSYIQRVKENVDYLPQDEEEILFDTVMGRACVEIAVRRHCGRIKTVYTPLGASYLQFGKDLTKVPLVVGTGGVIINHPEPGSILMGVLFDERRPEVLAPAEPHFLLDRSYILAAMGLLAEVKPGSALRILKKYLVPV